MEDAAVFKRHVQYHEWKHKILKFKMENIKEDIKTINKCKVSVCMCQSTCSFDSFM